MKLGHRGESRGTAVHGEGTAWAKALRLEGIWFICRTEK